MKQLISAVAIVGGLSLLILMGGCGTTIGNPQGDINVKSTPYNNTGVFLWYGARTLLSPPPLDSAAAAISEFKFCNTKLKLVASDGSTVAGASFETRLGLIDISDSTAETTWGTIPNAPVEVTISEMSFELHVDAETCSGVGYSVRYNGKELSKDLEFKFKVDPPEAVVNGSTVSLGLTAIATALENADTAGQFTNEFISNYLTAATVGTGDVQ